MDSLSRKTWRRFEKKRSMFLLLQISHLDNKNVWFLCKSVMLLCCYVISVMLYSFVKIVSQFKNDVLLLRKQHKKWDRMPFLKWLKRSLMFIYLLIALAFSSTSVFMQIFLRWITKFITLTNNCSRLLQ